MSQDAVNLECECGSFCEGLTNESAYTAGWRLGNKGPLCPMCARDQDAKHYKKCVQRYGARATAHADRMVRRLLG